MLPGLGHLKLEYPSHYYNLGKNVSFLQVSSCAYRMHAEQGAGQILQGASGNSETLTASGVLSLETSSADSQISSPFACKFLPALEYFPGDGDFVRLLSFGGKNIRKGCGHMETFFTVILYNRPICFEELEIFIFRACSAIDTSQVKRFILTLILIGLRSTSLWAVNSFRHRAITLMKNRFLCVLFYLHEPRFSKQLGRRAICQRLAFVGAKRRGWKKRRPMSGVRNDL